MKAARLHEYGKPLVLEDIPIPDIQPDEILVQVKACGMCRSDVQLVDGYFRPYADIIKPPITLGHEITGVVSKIGSIVPKTSGFKEGDHVVVAPGWGDGTCRHCQIGNTHICPNVRWPGFGPVGGFAEFIPVPARYLIKVRKDLPFEQLAPLTDAGMTPYRGLKKLRDAGALGPDRVIGVFGVGGLGGYAVQYAKILAPGQRSWHSLAAIASSLSPRNTGPTTSLTSRASPSPTLARNSTRPVVKRSSTRSSTASALLR
jgi:propanol-preferring alcohol dehydrogenase